MNSLGEKVKNVFIGFLIGIGFILPGLSGAVIAVVFGVYERLIEDVSMLRQRLKKDFWFIFTIALGLVLGFFVFVFLLDLVPDEYEIYISAIFVGMIIGQIPEIYKIAKNNEPVKRSHIMWFIIGLAAMLVILVIDGGNGSTDIVVDDRTYLFVLMIIMGLVLSISGIIPGISATTLLLAFGTFNLMIDTIADLDIVMILALGIGVMIGLLGFAKVMDSFIKNHHSATYYVILGLTVGSIFLIVPSVSGLETIVYCVLAGAVGLAISIAFNMYGKSQCAYEVIEQQ